MQFRSNWPQEMLAPGPVIFVPPKDAKVESRGQNGITTRLPQKRHSADISIAVFIRGRTLDPRTRSPLA
jgi:hypothetical protein